MTIQTRSARLLAHKSAPVQVFPTNVLFTYALRIKAGRVRYQATLTESQLAGLGRAIRRAIKR